MIIILLPYYMIKYYILGYRIYNKRFSTYNDWENGEILKFFTFFPKYDNKTSIRINFFQFRLVIDYIKNKK